MKTNWARSNSKTLLIPSRESGSIPEARIPTGVAIVGTHIKGVANGYQSKYC